MCPCLTIGASADTLEGSLNHLDRAGAQFKGLVANFNYIKHTAIVNEDSPYSGKIIIKRPKPGSLIGLLDFVSPDPRKVALGGDTVDIYLPNIKTVQEYDLGKHKLLVEQFILFGFGTSKSDLQAAYNVTYGGPEQSPAKTQPVWCWFPRMQTSLGSSPSSSYGFRTRRESPCNRNFMNPVATTVEGSAGTIHS